MNLLKKGVIAMLKFLAEEEEKWPTLEEVKRDYILSVLNHKEWNITASAKVLGVTRRSVYFMITRYGWGESLPRTRQKKAKQLAIDFKALDTTPAECEHPVELTETRG